MNNNFEEVKNTFNNEMEKIIDYIGSKDSNFEEELRMMNNLLNYLKKNIDLDNEIHAFGNPIERILYSTLDSYDSSSVSNILVYFLYFYFGLVYFENGIYDDAIINFKKSLKINMFFSLAIFKLSECYRITNDYDTMYNFLLDNHNYLYNAEDLGLFYQQLGDYYFDTKNYAFANTLYSYSEYYKSTSYNQQKLTKIASIEGRILKVDPIEDIIPYLKERQIPISVSNNVLENLIKIYNVPANDSMKKSIKALDKKILYDLTKNEQFAPSAYLRNNELGFIIEIPNIWQVVSKVNYNKASTSENTLYVIKPLSRVTINVTKLDKIEEKDFKQKYFEYKNNYISDGYNILLESMVKNNGLSYIQAFVEQEVLNDLVINVHNYVYINGYIVDFDIPVNEVSVNKDKLLHDKNVVRINNILSSIKIFNIEKKEEEEFTF